jgi:hypothetical protein
LQFSYDHIKGIERAFAKVSYNHLRDFAKFPMILLGI